MNSFKDRADRNWTLDLNGNSLKRVLKLTGVLLTELDVGTPPLSVRLATDTILQVDVLYALLEPDLTAADLTDEDFGKGLGPEALKAGVAALQQELLDFFLRSGRTDQADVLRTQAAFLTRVTTRKSERLAALDLDALLDSVIPLPPPLQLPSPPAPSGNATPKPPEFSESTPSRSASAPSTSLSPPAFDTTGTRPPT